MKLASHTAASLPLAAKAEGASAQVIPARLTSVTGVSNAPIVDPQLSTTTGVPLSRGSAAP